MKNLKFFGIVMMLVMGMSFTSCSSDDDEPGASAGSIKEYLEGEWFLVEEKEKNADGDIDLIKWNYDDQTDTGENPDTGDCHYEPCKLLVRHIEGNTYQLIEERCVYGVWETYTTDEYELVGNVIYEIIVHNIKVYIKSISENTLVIVEEQKWPGGEEESETRTYRRNN